MVLSKTTCRKTPKEGCAISRVRDFYMRKVQCTEQNFTKKLSIIIEEFPHDDDDDDDDDSNPIYDNHVYINKDHYKLALAKLNSTRDLLARIGKDYVKWLIYAFTIYQCKCLKVAALGCMVTAIERIGPGFAYLELIRQRMARFPSVDNEDPNTRPIYDCLNRFHVAIPKTRGERERPPGIPQAVLEAKAKEDANFKEKMKQLDLERDVEKENIASADGYFASLKKHSVLGTDHWEEDIMPEILDGHNVYDFIDPDILQRLQDLKQEGIY